MSMGRMTVTRLETADGVSSPNPPLDPHWSEFDQLRWQAGLLSYDTGMLVTVEVKRTGRFGRARYGISYPNGAAGDFTFEAAGRILTGFGMGVGAARMSLRA